MIQNQEHTDCDEVESKYGILRYLQPHTPEAAISPFRWMFELCRRENLGISIDEKVLGGVPHIDDTRLSVGQVLGRLYMLGSILAVTEYYSELNLSEDQVKEAISFAQDFVELAGDPYQPYD